MKHIIIFLILIAAMPALAQTEPFIKAAGEEVVVGVSYHANSVTEFLWGLTRPIHLWNVESGKVKILPFWTHPLQAGGCLSWMSGKAWKENPSLTLGALISEAAIVAVAASSGGGGGGGGDAETVTTTTTTSSSGGGGDDGGGGGGGGGDTGGGDTGGGGGDETPW